MSKSDSDFWLYNDPQSFCRENNTVEFRIEIADHLVISAMEPQWAEAAPGSSTKLSSGSSNLRNLQRLHSSLSHSPAADFTALVFSCNNRTKDKYSDGVTENCRREVSGRSNDEVSRRTLRDNNLRPFYKCDSNNFCADMTNGKDFVSGVEEAIASPSTSSCSLYLSRKLDCM